MTRIVVLLFAQIAAILLIVSSLEHLANPFRFLDGILQYKLVSFHTAQMIAATLPMVSLVAGLAVLLPPTRKPGLLLVGLLGIVFMTVQATALLRDLVIDCGCFDPFRSSEISWKSLLLPMILACGGFISFFLDRPDENTAQKEQPLPQSA